MQSYTSQIEWFAVANEFETSELMKLLCKLLSNKITLLCCEGDQYENRQAESISLWHFSYSHDYELTNKYIGKFQ